MSWRIGTAVCAVAALVAVDCASARSMGSGTASALGRSWNMPRSQWAHLFHHCAFGCPVFARRKFRQFPYVVVTDEGLAYGPNDDVEPYAPHTANGLAAAPAAYRPTCHFETQKYVVPSEAGGQSKVSVTRCVNAALQVREPIVEK
jgi:hypothetical protein